MPANMSDKHTLVMVNYLNSKPFDLGLKRSALTSSWNIITETPAKCAALFADGEADVALVPVGALPALKNYKVITDYCIGCDGAVRTVCIFSHTPINFCKRILMDTHSRTSVLLSGIMMHEYFGVSPQTLSWDGQSMPGEDEAVLMIGDKVFGYESSFAYRYDLGEIWKLHTGLPFVFAVWVAQPHLGTEEETVLNQAFAYGVDHLLDIIRKESTENLDLYYYYHHNIRYKLDEDKKQAMNLFFKKSDALSGQ